MMIITIIIIIIVIIMSQFKKNFPHSIEREYLLIITINKTSL
jgi:hypothetical protein